MSFNSCEKVGENQTNGVLWTRVLKKTWKIDKKVVQKKEFDRQ